MNKFKYQSVTLADTNTIGIKARSLFMKKVTFDQHTTYDSLYDFKECVNSVFSKTTSHRNPFRNSIPYTYKWSTNQTCNVYFNNDNVNINYRDAKGDARESGIYEKYKTSYSMYSLGNIYLGIVDNRVYTILGYGDFSTDTPYIAIESFPVELMMHSFTKEFYSTEYTLFKDVFNQRTITLLSDDPTSEPITYYPSEIVSSQHIQSRIRKNSISLANIKSLKFSVLNCINLPDKDNYDIDHNCYDRDHKQLFYALLDMTNESLVVKLLDTYISNIVSHRLLKPLEFDKTILGIFNGMVDDDLLIELENELRKFSNRIFKSDVLVEQSVKYVFMLYGLGYITNVHVESGFVNFKNFVGVDVCFEEGMLEGVYNKLPINRIMRHDGFADDKIVRLVVDGDDASIQYTEHGLQFVGSWFTSDKDYIETNKLTREDIDNQLLTMLFYMSQPFLMDVIHYSWFNKNNIKQFLKRSYYVGN